MTKTKRTDRRGYSRPSLPKKRRYKPGTLALRQIRHYQKTTDLQLKKLPFSRVVREIVQEMKADNKFTPSALGALREATEAYTTTLLEDSNLVTIHSKRITVMKKDISLIMRIRGEATDIVEEKKKASLKQGILNTTGKKITPEDAAARLAEMGGED